MSVVAFGYADEGSLYIGICMYNHHVAKFCIYPE